MRLFLLPISTRRTLIYCERVQAAVTGAKPPIIDRITNKASETWVQWEKAEKGWKKKLTDYGNEVFKRIPYEEWGLKSIPPGTAQRLKDAREGKVKFKVLFPRTFVGEDKVPGLLRRLAVERQALHRKHMWWSIAVMPITLPFQLIPVIPNIPFYYACYRAWSHYRAWYGGKLLEYLCKNDLLKYSPSRQLDELYAAGLLNPTRSISRAASTHSAEEMASVVQTVESQTNSGKEDTMVLQRWNGKLIAEAFDLPEMEVEIERAVEQVEKNIKEKVELVLEKKEREKATSVAPQVRAQEIREKQ